MTPIKSTTGKELFLVQMPFIPKHAENKNFSIHYYPVNQPTLSPSQEFDFNVEGCLFYATKNYLCYKDLMNNTVVKVPIRGLNSYYLTVGSKVLSYWLEVLKPISYNIPDRVYHLASIIKTEHPSFQWDFFDQLEDFEKRRALILMRKQQLPGEPEAFRMERDIQQTYCKQSNGLIAARRAKSQCAKWGLGLK